MRSSIKSETPNKGGGEEKFPMSGRYVKSETPHENLAGSVVSKRPCSTSACASKQDKKEILNEIYSKDPLIAASSLVKRLLHGNEKKIRVTTKKKKKRKKRKAPSAARQAQAREQMARPYKWSSRLSNILRTTSLGEDSSYVNGNIVLSRPNVCKGLWEYAKTNNLQDPLDRRVFRCNSTLEEVLGTSGPISMLNLSTYVAPHCEGPADNVSEHNGEDSWPQATSSSCSDFSLEDECSSIAKKQKSEVENEGTNDETVQGIGLSSQYRKLIQLKGSTGRSKVLLTDKKSKSREFSKLIVTDSSDEDDRPISRTTTPTTKIADKAGFFDCFRDMNVVARACPTTGAQFVEKPGSSQKGSSSVLELILQDENQLVFSMAASYDVMQAFIEGRFFVRLEHEIVSEEGDTALSVETVTLDLRREKNGSFLFRGFVSFSKCKKVKLVGCFKSSLSDGIETHFPLVEGEVVIS